MFCLIAFFLKEEIMKCIVETCSNSLKNEPHMNFFLIPDKPLVERERWFQSVGIDLHDWTRHRHRMGMSRAAYCCQNHFNLSEDIRDEQCSRILRLLKGSVLSSDMLKAGCYPRVVVRENIENENVVFVVEPEEFPVEENHEPDPLAESQPMSSPLHSVERVNPQVLGEHNLKPFDPLSRGMDPQPRVREPAGVPNLRSFGYVKLCAEPQCPNSTPNLREDFFFQRNDSLRGHNWSEFNLDRSSVFYCRAHHDAKINATQTESEMPRIAVGLDVAGGSVEFLQARSLGDSVGDCGSSDASEPEVKCEGRSRNEEPSVKEENCGKSETAECKHNSETLQCRQLARSDIVAFKEEFSALTDERRDKFIFQNMDREVKNGGAENLIFFITKRSINGRIPVCYDTFCRALDLTPIEVIPKATRFFDAREEAMRSLVPPASPDSPEILDDSNPEALATSTQIKGSSTPDSSSISVSNDHSSDVTYEPEESTSGDDDVIEEKSSRQWWPRKGRWARPKELVSDVDEEEKAQPAQGKPLALSEIPPQASNLRKSTLKSEKPRNDSDSYESITPQVEKEAKLFILPLISATAPTESETNKSHYISYDICHRCLTLTQCSEEYKSHRINGCKRRQCQLPVRCLVCSEFEAHSVRCLKVHIQTMHKYVCKFCAMSYSVLEEVEDHLKDCKRLPDIFLVNSSPAFTKILRTRLEKSKKLDEMALKLKRLKEASSGMTCDVENNRRLAERVKRRDEGEPSESGNQLEDRLAAKLVSPRRPFDRLDDGANSVGLDVAEIQRPKEPKSSKCVGGMFSAKCDLEPRPGQSEPDQLNRSKSAADKGRKPVTSDDKDGGRNSERRDVIEKKCSKAKTIQEKLSSTRESKKRKRPSDSDEVELSGNSRDVSKKSKLSDSSKSAAAIGDSSVQFVNKRRKSEEGKSKVSVYEFTDRDNDVICVAEKQKSASENAKIVEKVAVGSNLVRKKVKIAGVDEKKDSDAPVVRVYWMGNVKAPEGKAKGADDEQKSTSENAEKVAVGSCLVRKKVKIAGVDEKKDSNASVVRVNYSGNVKVPEREVNSPDDVTNRSIKTKDRASQSAEDRRPALAPSSGAIQVKANVRNVTKSTENKHHAPLPIPRYRVCVDFGYRMCPKCRRQFDSLDDIKRHIAADCNLKPRHVEKAEGLIYCRTCSVHFGSERSLSFHVTRSPKCANAILPSGSSFPGIVGPKGVVENPGVLKMYQCDTCGACFGYKMGIISHGKNSPACKPAGNGGYELRTLEEINKKKAEIDAARRKTSDTPHTSTPPVKPQESSKSSVSGLTCPVCRRLASGEDDFLAHFAVHGRSDSSKRGSRKKVQCRVCSFLFVELEHMIKHILRDHPGAFPCPVCDFFTGSFDSLYAHAQSTHSKEKECV